MRSLRTDQVRAFTLIELLVVVAIIAILAAIALPNFLEAQMRAKVSRARADMRSFATAAEAYCVDHNCYPPSVDPLSPIFAPWSPRVRRFIALTTPVAYLTSALPDLFSDETPPAGYDARDQQALAYWGPDYLNVTPDGTDWSQHRAQHYFPEFPEVSDGRDLRRKPLWSILSFGPDRDNDLGDSGWPSPLQAYDPTNGTVSDGDVIRFRQ